MNTNILYNKYVIESIPCIVWLLVIAYQSSPRIVQVNVDDLEEVVSNLVEIVDWLQFKPSKMAFPIE